MNEPALLSEEVHSVCRLRAKREYADGLIGGTAECSGFLWRRSGRVYLLSNWHCLSGMHPTTKEPIGSFLPNQLEIQFRIRKRLPNGDVSRPLKMQVSLEDEFGERTWIEHPHGSEVDVAALPLRIKEDEENQFFCMNEIDSLDSWQPEPSSDAFIVGYPEGFSADFGTPIWKRASIASEPNVSFEGKPIILVDTIGNRELSGAAVIARASGMHLPSGKLDGDAVIGSWKKFLGIYSGRLSASGIGSQIGRVWKSSVIEEILDHSR